MIEKIQKTIEVSIYIAGDLNLIRKACMEFCKDGLCVTIIECEYIFTQGYQKGVKIGMINYPRFPSSLERLRLKARQLAKILVKEAYQGSVSVIDPEETYWYSERKADQNMAAPMVLGIESSKLD